jgi:hypothetical protein
MSARRPNPIPLEHPDPPPPPGRPCPSCGQRLAPGGIHCSNCGFNLVRGWGPEPGVSSSSESEVCRKCGYDLTGNFSGLCPECGDRRKFSRTPARPAAPKPFPCGRCGYDLVGNVSGICPECGLPAPKVIGTRAASLMPTAADAMRSAYIRIAICAGIAALLFPIPYHTATDLARALIGTAVAAPVGFVLYYIASMIWNGFDTPLRLAFAQVLAVTAFLVAVAGLVGIASALRFGGNPYGAVSVRGLVYFAVAGVTIHTVMDEDLEDSWVGALPLAVAAALAVPATYWLVP